MFRKLWLILFAVSLIPISLLAQSGKIRGTVVDAKTKETLIGANIIVEGTRFGASTDVNGEYVIINVPVETYTIKASYVGYRTVTMTNVRVNSNLTTETNFQLSSEDVQVQAVEIIAQRPLVNKSATGAVRVIDNDFFTKLPARGINAAIQLQPGVVQKGNDFYIRGGRSDETGFSVDGVAVTNIVSGGRAVTVTAEAIEQIQVLTGGYTAEFGGSSSGLVRSELRSGGDAWRFMGLFETDQYTGQGKKSLGGYSYGYSDMTFTAGGPLGSDVLRFFGSFQNTHFADPAVRVWDGYDFKGVTMFPTTTAVHPASSISDTVDLVGLPGNTYGGKDDRYTISGTLGINLSEVQLRAGGSFSSNKSRNTTTLANIFNQSRLPENINSDGTGNVKLTAVLSPTTYFEAKVNYMFTNTETRDPDFGADLALYGDSAANAGKGYTLLQEGQNFSGYQIIMGGSGRGELGTINQPGAQINGYAKTKLSGLGGRADFTSQLSKTAEIKLGGEYTGYTFRRFGPASVINWAKDFKDPLLNPDDRTPEGKLARRLRNYGPNNVGYDVFGNEIDNNTTAGDAVLDLGKRSPVIAAGYFQSKIELTDITMNLGLRYDYISADAVQWADPSKLSFVDTLAAIETSNYETTPAHSFVSPRIGFSFPVTDRTVFYTQYGRFIQQPRLVESFRGTALFYNVIKGGFFYADPVAFGLRPEQTTSYEIGFQQQVADNASFDVAAFYKDIVDQVTYTNVIAGSGAPHSSYVAYVNGDFATTKGLEFKFTLRRTNRIQASVNYTLSDARGTGSTPNAQNGAFGGPLGGGVFAPKYVVPLTFNQSHRGNISLDYRFDKNDGGPILEQMGVNVLAQFNSGSSFTRLAYNSPVNAGDARFRSPIEEVGASTTPWFFQVDARLDKTFSFGSFNLNAYVYVINLLGTDNAVGVFNRTGDPKDDGWFGIAEGRGVVSQLGSEGELYKQMYRALTEGRNSGNFGPPRQVRFGVRVDL